MAQELTACMYYTGMDVHNPEVYVYEYSTLEGLYEIPAYTVHIQNAIKLERVRR